MLGIAIVLMTVALVLYSSGVWAARRHLILKPWHIAFFYVGFACDLSGTFIMRGLSSGDGSGSHAFIGALALGLMLVHAVWGTVVYVRKNENELRIFHKFSIGIWILWLITYMIGLFSNM